MTSAIGVVNNKTGKRKTNGRAAARKMIPVGPAKVSKADTGAIKNTTRAAVKKPVAIGRVDKACKAVQNSLAAEANAKCGKAALAIAGVANAPTGAASVTMESKARANGKVSVAGSAEPKAGKAAAVVVGKVIDGKASNLEAAVGKAITGRNTAVI